MLFSESCLLKLYVVLCLDFPNSHAEALHWSFRAYFTSNYALSLSIILLYFTSPDSKIGGSDYNLVPFLWFRAHIDAYMTICNRVFESTATYLR